MVQLHTQLLRLQLRAQSTAVSNPSSGSFNVAKFIKYGPGGRSSVAGQTVTVFGATGFLGRYVVNELARQGVQVVVPFRGDQDSARHLKVCGDLGQVVPLKFDMRDDQSIEEAIRHSDVVYNLVGRNWETMHFNFEQVHVDFPRKLAQKCKERGIGRFVHVSALGASTEVPSEFLKSKALGERSVKFYFPEAIIVRPGTLYGWEDRFLNYLGAVVTHQLKRYFTGGFALLVNGGERVFYPAYVGDVGRALAKLSFEPNAKDLYEFHGPAAMTYYELVELFCEYTRRPFFPLPVPHKLMRRLVEFTQRSPLAKMTVHDVDRMAISDKLTPEAGQMADVGVEAQAIEDLMIRFVRHFRSGEFEDEPATLAELKLYQRAKPARR